MTYSQLAREERYQIFSLHKEGFSQCAIARSLGRDPSTICRELQRNQGQHGYRPTLAQRMSDRRRRRAHKHRKVTPVIWQWIKQLLQQELSPDQISHYLKEHKQVSLNRVSIYRLIHLERAQGGRLFRHLRIVSKPYRKRYRSIDERGQIPDRTSIDARPAVVEARQRIGDWEGDTIVGKRHKSALLTLVERKTLYTVIVKLTGKRADLLTVALIDSLSGFKQWVKTLTFDNGWEFSFHQKIAKALKADVYFAHPYASWERGINENTNGLIRQYFPKGTDFNQVSEEQVALVMQRLNQRPRKTRGYRSPTELFLGQSVDLLTQKTVALIT
jgi:IS30 family transposase